MVRFAQGFFAATLTMVGIVALATIHIASAIMDFLDPEPPRLRIDPTPRSPFVARALGLA